MYHPSAAERMTDIESEPPLDNSRWIWPCRLQCNGYFATLILDEEQSESVAKDSTLLYIDSQVMQWLPWRDHHTMENTFK